MSPKGAPAFFCWVTAVSPQRPTGRNGGEPARGPFGLEVGEPRAPLRQGLGATWVWVGSRSLSFPTWKRGSLCVLDLCWGQMDFCDMAPLVGVNVAELSSVPQKWG